MTKVAKTISLNDLLAVINIYKRETNLPCLVLFRDCSGGFYSDLDNRMDGIGGKEFDSIEQLLEIINESK